MRRAALVLASLITIAGFAGCSASAGPADAGPTTAPSAPTTTTAATDAPASSTSAPEASTSTSAPSTDATLPGGMRKATVEVTIDGKQLEVGPMACTDAGGLMSFVQTDTDDEEGLVLSIDPKGPTVSSLVISAGGHSVLASEDGLTVERSGDTWTVSGTVMDYGKSKKLKLEIVATCG